ncbi:MAG TPA: anaerobic ribonucleoside triphosphate reductase [Candidatus Butyricicoccus stercorigallinarum]|nr:anaerobic ribonucleoside triphosphate reductase [Candidatus Butyricicoccus stercorigallinarum]
MIQQIEKRDGRCVFFDVTKIANAIYKAAEASGGHDYQMSMRLALDVADYVEAHSPTATPTVEYVQDAVEKILVESGHAKTAKAYILYRNERSRQREMNTGLMKIYEDLTIQSAIENDIKRENANIDGDTAMGTMLKYGSEGAKQFNEMFLLEPHIAKAHREGDIHIHDFDFYTLTTTCTQIDLLKLFDGGFSTGHGFLREPNDIMSYSALACIAIQSNQNDQHGGQSVPNFDYSMAPGVRKTYWHRYRDNLAKALEAYGVEDDALETAKALIEACDQKPVLADDNGASERIRIRLLERTDVETVDKILAFAVKYARRETERATYQAMEALVHNLNTMHSRAGAQIPFSSLNYGTDTSPEARLVTKSLLLATEAGLGNGETSIFPIHIFKVKEGVNYNPGDPNYDLFKLAIRVSAKRLFPNFSFLDAPFNAQYYKPGHPETEAAYMGCRTRVIGNNFDPSREIVNGRGNLSFTSINLPRIAIKANGDAEAFFEELDAKLDLVIDQLKARFKIQSDKRVRNYPFLMGQGVWIDSDKLSPDDKIGTVLKHGSLTVGFIGLAECLRALMGKHHGESEQAQRMGLTIVARMRARVDRESRETGMNFTIIATPAEGLSGRFTRLDRARYGVIPGVTDRDYYTNSFHVPVYYPISAFKKIQLEAPYHALTNGGHISYVELDGDPTQNLDAFEAVIRYMKDCGIGYGSINHPVDRDPICGYTGIIGDVCPRCGRREGEAVSVEKLRQLGVYKNYNSETIGYHGDPNEERDRRPNPLA